MRRRKQQIRMTVVMMILVLTAVFGVSGTVLSQQKGMSKEKQSYYRAMEQEYVRELRDFLKEQGYQDSGVTMNRIIDEDERVEYVVTIHHRRILELDEQEKEHLLMVCGEIEFPVRDCGFSHKFLETDL